MNKVSKSVLGQFTQVPMLSVCTIFTNIALPSIYGRQSVATGIDDIIGMPLTNNLGKISMPGTGAFVRCVWRHLI